MDELDLNDVIGMELIPMNKIADRQCRMNIPLAEVWLSRPNIRPAKEKR
jgi:hypothetical protein